MRLPLEWPNALLNRLVPVVRVVAAVRPGVGVAVSGTGSGTAVVRRLSDG
jgi:hypothetical protein